MLLFIIIFFVLGSLLGVIHICNDGFMDNVNVKKRQYELEDDDWLPDVHDLYKHLETSFEKSPY